MARPYWRTELMVKLLRANIKQNELRSRLDMAPPQLNTILSGGSASDGMVAKIIGTVNRMVAERENQ